MRPEPQAHRQAIAGKTCIARLKQANTPHLRSPRPSSLQQRSPLT
jgi:hypothetical protein